MANPLPTPRPANLRPWPKGVSGNPAGYSRKRRLGDALFRQIEGQGLVPELTAIWLAAALGELPAGRRPDFRFFKELLDRIDGPVTVATGEPGPDPGDDIPSGIDFPSLDEWLRGYPGSPHDSP